MTGFDDQLGSVLTTVCALVAAYGMVVLGVSKRRLAWRRPYCRVCRARHRGACKIRLTL